MRALRVCAGIWVFAAIASAGLGIAALNVGAVWYILFELPEIRSFDWPMLIMAPLFVTFGLGVAAIGAAIGGAIAVGGDES